MGFVAAVILLGVLIFIHETGHFLTARILGVCVPKFSIGFGPKITGFKFKGTEFVISVFPLGGYVKMKGDNIHSDKEENKIDNDDIRSKSLWRKMLIVLAGPVANIIFSWVFILAADLTMNQEYISTTSLGRIDRMSSAEIAGLKPGDEILNINGNVVGKWSEVENYLFSSPEDTIFVHIARMEGIDEVQLDIKIPPDTIDSFYRGLSPDIRPIIGKVIGEPAIDAGLVKGDVIFCFIPSGEDSEILYSKKDTLIGIETALLDSSEIIILPFEESKLEYSKFIPVYKVEYWSDVGRLINSMENDSFTLGIIRDKKKILINVGSIQTVDGSKIIGIVFDLPTKKLGFSRSFTLSIQQMKITMYLMAKLPEMLIKKQISVRESVGGPVRIFQETSKAAAMGIDTFLFIAGFISLNLGLFNLFPLMPLDGGHLAVYFVEAIIRRPLSIKFIRVYQIIGLTILMSLVILVTANDLINVFAK